MSEHLTHNSFVHDGRKPEFGIVLQTRNNRFGPRSIPQDQDIPVGFLKPEQCTIEKPPRINEEACQNPADKKDPTTELIGEDVEISNGK